MSTAGPGRPGPAGAGRPTDLGESSQSRTREPARRCGPQNRPPSLSDRTAQLETPEGGTLWVRRESTRVRKRRPQRGALSIITHSRMKRPAGEGGARETLAAEDIR